MAQTGARAAPAMMLKSGSDSGFTLLEVLMVLTILGLAALLVVPNLGGIESRTFDAQVREAHALLNHARRTAVVRGLPAEVVFRIGDEAENNGDNAFPGGAATGTAAQSAAQSATQAGSWQARGISVAFRDSNNQRRDVNTQVEVMFFPEGGSTGGDLIMRQGDRMAVVSVDPFSGRVRTHRDEN